MYSIVYTVCCIGSTYTVYSIHYTMHSTCMSYIYIIQYAMYICVHVNLKVSLQLTPFNQIVYLLGSSVIFSILFVTIDPQLDSCIMYNVYPSEQVKLFIYNINELQTFMINSVIKVCKKIMNFNLNSEVC